MSSHFCSSSERFIQSLPEKGPSRRLGRGRPVQTTGAWRWRGAGPGLSRGRKRGGALRQAWGGGGSGVSPALPSYCLLLHTKVQHGHSYQCAFSPLSPTLRVPPPPPSLTRLLPVPSSPQPLCSMGSSSRNPAGPKVPMPGRVSQK